MKQKLFLDMDSTITDSAKAYCDTYNYIFEHHPDFIPADASKNNDWDFETQCPLAKHMVIKIFGYDKFFEFLKPFPNAIETLHELFYRYDTYIVSIGSLNNISKKAIWIKDKLPFIKNTILICNDGCKMDKSIVNMGYPDSIFIDDVSSNLKSSNARYKYNYGKVFPWNEDWNGERVTDWNIIRMNLL